MKTPRKSSCGQSLVETVLVFPLLLILLGGGYWFYRDLSLTSSSESAAHAHMLRSGRHFGGIEPFLARTIHPVDNAVHISAHADSVIGEVPLFHGLSGRTISTTDVSIQREPVGGFLDLPPHSIRVKAEGTVDCWGKETPSGSLVRRTVKGFLLTGVLR